MRNRWLPWLLLSPAIVLIMGLTVYPLINTFLLSFQHYDMYSLVGGVSEWIGLDHYVEILQDPFFWVVTRNTVIFGLSCVIATMLVGLAVALLLNTKFKGSKVLGVIILIPWVFPAIAGGIVWRWMFNDQYGVVNYVLSSIGLGMFEGFAWFNTPLTAFFVIFLIQKYPKIA
jgi:N,N'-diacetylchitobiose transport system permease protein